MSCTDMLGGWRRSCELVCCAWRPRDRVTVARSCKLPNLYDEPVTQEHVVYGHPEPDGGGHKRRCAHAARAIASVAKSCWSPNPDDEPVTQVDVMHEHLGRMTVVIRDGVRMPSARSRDRRQKL